MGHVTSLQGGQGFGGPASFVEAVRHCMIPDGGAGLGEMDVPSSLMPAQSLAAARIAAKLTNGPVSTPEVGAEGADVDELGHGSHPGFGRCGPWRPTEAVSGPGTRTGTKISTRGPSRQTTQTAQLYAGPCLLSPAASPWPPPTPAHRGECSPWTPASRGTGRSSRQWRWRACGARGGGCQLRPSVLFIVHCTSGFAFGISFSMRSSSAGRSRPSAPLFTRLAVRFQPARAAQRSFAFIHFSRSASFSGCCATT